MIEILERAFLFQLLIGMFVIDYAEIIILHHPLYRSVTVWGEIKSIEDARQFCPRYIWMSTAHYSIVEYEYKGKSKQAFIMQRLDDYPKKKILLAVNELCAVRAEKFKILPHDTMTYVTRIVLTILIVSGNLAIGYKGDVNSLFRKQIIIIAMLFVLNAIFMPMYQLLLNDIWRRQYRLKERIQNEQYSFYEQAQNVDKKEIIAIILVCLILLIFIILFGG